MAASGNELVINETDRKREKNREIYLLSILILLKVYDQKRFMMVIKLFWSYKNVNIMRYFLMQINDQGNLLLMILNH